MEWPIDFIPYLSPTKINMFRRCPEQFRRRYILGEKTKPAWALLAGDADHRAIAHDLEHRVGEGPGIPTDEVLDFASEYCLNTMAEEGGPEAYDWGNLAADVTGPGDYKLLAQKQRSQMLKGVSLYHTQVCPTLRPTDVEWEFDMEIPNLPVPMRGYVDVSLEEGVGVERKTTGRKRSSLPGDWRVQGMCYTLATGEPMRWDVTVRTASPEVLPSRFTLPVAEVQRKLTLQIIKNAAEGMAHLFETKGAYQPWPDAIDHEWACRLCGWGPISGNDTCPWWAR